MKTINYISLFILCLLLQTCIEPFDPKIAPAPQHLVVEGLITNQNKSHVIKLSFLKNINIVKAEGLSKADVRVIDNNGIEYVFKEKNRGEYHSDSIQFLAQIGNIYTLKIVTKEGKVYQSSPEKMLPQPTINSIYNVYNDENSEEEGFYIYIDIKDNPEEGNSYRWESTYYSIKPRCRELTTLCCELCWKIYRVPNRIMISEDKYYNNMNSTMEVFRVPYDSRSSAFVNIEQYSMTTSSYQFWSQLKKQIANVGSIFDPIPSSIGGNMECKTEPNEKVYGCFSVSSYSLISYSVRRDYITRNPITENLPPLPPGPPSCNPCDESLSSTKIKPTGWKF